MYRSIFKVLVLLVSLISFTTGLSVAAPTGPTLQLGYNADKPVDNPLYKFMYFVPLISPDPIAVSTTADNTQRARVISSSCQTNGTTFKANCAFVIVGEGLQHDVFDHADFIRQHEADLKAGKSLEHQLDAITVQGTGAGTVEIVGTLTNGHPAVSEVRLRFNSHDQTSPVSVTLHDIVRRDGAIHLENEIVARVNMLVFCLKSGSPKMEIVLDSVKPKTATDSFWQNCMGRIRGVVANFLIPPLNVPMDGHQAMMNFGLALATEQASFTFPFATRLKESTAAIH